MLALEGVVVERDGWRFEADLAVETGAAVAVVGPSGGGKSTLLGVIAGFVPLAAGRVTWAGRDLGASPPAARPVTLVFQEHNLFPHLSVAQNVGLGLHPGLRLTRADRDAVERALGAVGLAGYGTRRPGELSGGERSRVALARALLRERPLLLLDEPFAALGPALRTEMLDLVARIREETGATLLMVSHEPRDALRIAPQTILVAEGRAHPPAPTDALFADPPPALRAYLG
jgi:thiamine transport system ATP-binding protein